jgi:hypothetical protein
MLKPFCEAVHRPSLIAFGALDGSASPMRAAALQLEGIVHGAPYWFVTIRPGRLLLFGKRPQSWTRTLE